jgi:hypothetical protein
LNNPEITKKMFWLQRNWECMTSLWIYRITMTLM